MADVVFEHVRKTYPSGVLAVDDFSLSVADGELLVLVGPSGCGKTTLLRLVAGLEEPTSGGISIGGRPLVGLPPRKRNVAMVFQQDSLYTHLKVRDNLAFGLRLRRVARAEIERRVASAAKDLGIEDLLDRRPVELSGGQRQQVALGRALTGRPSVFLLDEPLASLDLPLRADVRRLVRRVHQQAATATLYVTHDQAEAMSLADRLAVVRAGRLAQVGHPLAVYRHPANRFVAQLIGSPAMNVLRGRLASRDGELFFEAGPSDDSGGRRGRRAARAGHARPRRGRPLPADAPRRWGGLLPGGRVPGPGRGHASRVPVRRGDGKRRMIEKCKQTPGKPGR